MGHFGPILPFLSTLGRSGSLGHFWPLWATKLFGPLWAALAHFGRLSHFVPIDPLLATSAVWTALVNFGPKWPKLP